MNYRYLPLQVPVWFGYFVYVFIGKALAPVMVPIGMRLDWPRWCWPWASFSERYADGWWYEGEHWSWRLGPAFAEFWWRAVRNGFSNGARYSIRNAEPGDLWQHPDYHYGFYKGPRRRAFAGHPKPWPKTLMRYEFDVTRPWLGRYVFTWFCTEARYFQFYVGFKFDRTEGCGFSMRCWIYRNET